jgi:hypothetical protein
MVASFLSRPLSSHQAPPPDDDRHRQRLGSPRPDRERVVRITLLWLPHLRLVKQQIQVCIHIYIYTYVRTYVRTHACLHVSEVAFCLVSSSDIGPTWRTRGQNWQRYSMPMSLPRD